MDNYRRPDDEYDQLKENAQDYLRHEAILADDRAKGDWLLRSRTNIKCQTCKDEGFTWQPVEKGESLVGLGLLQGNTMNRESLKKQVICKCAVISRP